MHRQFAMLPWQWKCEHTQNDEDNFSRSNLDSKSSCSYCKPTVSNHSCFTGQWNPCSCGGTPSKANIHPLNQGDSRAISVPDISHLLHWQCHHYLNNWIFPHSEENSSQHSAAAAGSLWLGWGHPQYGSVYSLPSNSTMEIGKVTPYWNFQIYF